MIYSLILLPVLTRLKLKPVCVNLSSVALRFRTKDAPVKEVLKALEAVKSVVGDLAQANHLDAKLSEYAFFPIAQQVFNEAKRLSPRCLEVATECVILLVNAGYRNSLQPELGKQLIILMSMLAGAGPNGQTTPPTDELKIASFKCIAAVIKALVASERAPIVFEDQGSRNVVDQLVYLLLEAITESPSEHVQHSASEVLLQLMTVLKSRLFLASLLPRTVSSLTKALKPSTKARRTQRVLVTNLRILRKVLDRTLSDAIISGGFSEEEKEALDGSWFKATSAQVKNALIQVCKLRIHDSAQVRRAIEELCVMVVEQCRQTLGDSLPVVLETLVVLAASPDGQSAQSTCRYLVTAYSETAEVLQMSFMNWSQSLPRLLQGQDERTKQLALQKLIATVPLLDQIGTKGTVSLQSLTPLLLHGVENMIQDTPSNTIELHQGDISPDALITEQRFEHRHFSKFLLNHESQKNTMKQLQLLIATIQESAEHLEITQKLVYSVADTNGLPRLASFWLALQLLIKHRPQTFDIDDLLVSTAGSASGLTRSSLLADLHATSIGLLSSTTDEQYPSSYHWQLQALGLEALTLYAETFPSDSYRPELIDALYPVLSFLTSPNSILRSHAITALDKLAITCQYASAQDLLVQNVDYLVNSIAWKLNTYSLSPEAPQLLRMMVHLCGAELVPYLDDLIQSIFAALDSYHAYPEWVETLFSALKSVVGVSIKQPQLAIAHYSSPPTNHSKAALASSTTSDVVSDLRAQKCRKRDFDRSADEPPTEAPHRPWTNALDGPSFPKSMETTEEDLNEANDDSVASAGDHKDEEKKLSKSHTLLLSIAQSTVPHLASPSPYVRHLLLNLLKDISPLLSRDENSFLPLINAIWPVGVPRLFAAEDKREDSEMAYNITAAADTIATLCMNAGDFMASRIEDIFQQLIQLFRTMQPQERSSRTHADTALSQDLVDPRACSISRKLSSPVKLRTNAQQGQSSSLNLTEAQHSTNGTLQSVPPAPRTSKTLIFDSLVNLLLSILSHVRLTLDTGDEIIRALLPLIEVRHGMREVLEVYNADAVWWYQTRRKGAEQIPIANERPGEIQDVFEDARTALPRDKPAEDRRQAYEKG